MTDEPEGFHRSCDHASRPSGGGWPRAATLVSGQRGHDPVSFRPT